MISFLKAQRSPWTVLVAGCWLEAVSGLSYVYSTYSGVLKSQLLYNQRQINALAVAKDLGDHVGLAAGFLSGILPDWALPLLGSVLILGGYGVLWLFVGSIITGIPFWLVCIIIFFGTNGSTYLDTAALVVCLSNFPSNRASAVGLLKGFKGLSCAIYNQIYASFLTPDQTAFILFIALVPVVVVGPLILMMGLSVNTSVANDNGNSNSQILFGVSLLLAAYMLVVTLLQDLCNISRGVNVLFTVLLFCILLLPLVIIKFKDSFNKDHVKGDLQSGKVVLQDGSSKDDDEGMRTPKMYAEVGEMPNTSSIFEENSDGENIEEQKLLQGSNQVPLLDPSDYTVWNALKNANFWLLVASIFFGMGTGTTAFDNLRQVAQAQGYENVEVFVSLANIFNFLGRIGGGYISEACTRRYGHPRALVLALSQVVMAVGHLVLALALPGTIYAAVFFIATGFGSQWAVFPTATSELFRLRNFGVLYNLVAIASPAGSIIYSTFMAGPIYDWQASKQGSSSCEGTVCFEITFFAMAAACILATALSIVLSARTRFLYAATRHALR